MIRHMLITSIVAISILKSGDASSLASKLGLFAGTKATVQWERVFASPRRMRAYKLDTIPQDQINELKIYLIEHALIRINQ